MLPTIPEADQPGDAKEESRIKEVRFSTSPLSSPPLPDVTRETAGLVVEDFDSGLSLNRLDAFRPHLQTEAPGPSFVEKEPKIERGSFSEQIITTPLPQTSNFSYLPVGPLEDLPVLPPSEPSSRSGTPDPVTGPASEAISPKLRGSHSSTKAKAEYLRLPSDVPRINLGDQDLPLSSDQSADNKYTNVSQPTDDPEDEDPSLSSFGSGIVQTVPVAQVGLRSPMFPGASGFGLLLGAIDSSTRRFFPQQSGLDINEESDDDSPAPDKDSQSRSTLSIGIDASTEDGGEEDKKGEEGWNSPS